MFVQWYVYAQVDKHSGVQDDPYQQSGPGYRSRHGVRHNDVAPVRR